jgi:uncharacterized protein YdcH (DUF465 family)
MEPAALIRIKAAVPCLRRYGDNDPEDAMSHTPHELHEEFPESAAKLHALKETSAHFRTLSERYHDVNRQIHRAEAEVEPMDDEALETLKKTRLHLKDEIATLLAKAA